MELVRGMQNLQSEIVQEGRDIQTLKNEVGDKETRIVQLRKERQDLRQKLLFDDFDFLPAAAGILVVMSGLRFLYGEFVKAVSDLCDCRAGFL